MFGVYGACSTMGESLAIGAMLVDGEFADYVVALTSSHFASAEKQFRYCLLYTSILFFCHYFSFGRGNRSDKKEK